MRLTSAANTLVRDIYRKATLKRLYPDRYRAAARQDVRPGSVVFLEIRSKTLSDNFRLIRSALEHRNAAVTQEESAVRYHISVISIQEGMENRAVVVQNCLEAIPTLAHNVSNIIRISESSPKIDSLVMYNQGTDCFFELLISAADDFEKTEHQKELISFLEDQKALTRLHPERLTLIS